jgi:hypothetical protein
MIESNVSLHFFNDGFFSWIELACGRPRIAIEVKPAA